jgi:hypothetical protein
MKQAEMIQHAPHLDAMGNPHPMHMEDNQQVWNILSNICKDTAVWGSICFCEYAKDGCRGYLESSSTITWELVWPIT